MLSNKELVKYLIANKKIHTKDIKEAFLAIDRKDFVRDPTENDIYVDYPKPIGYGQTISQPSTVAMMLEMLQPQKGDTVLDIGSGSGWTTALLGYIVGKEGSVTGLERIPELVAFANNNLKKYNLPQVRIEQAKEDLGIKGQKFDRILVSAAANELPIELIEQLKTNGKLVVPVKNTIYEITKKENEELEVVQHYGFRFVPLIV